MDLAKLNDWMQLFGTFAIVASLIFVGLQMQQTQAIAVANQYQERAALILAFRDAQLQNNVVAEFEGISLSRKVAGLEGWSQIKTLIETNSPEVVGLHWISIRRMIAANDNNHFQYQSGFLAEDIWVPYRNSMQQSLKSEMYLFVWNETKHGYRPEYRNLVDQLIADNDNGY